MKSAGRSFSDELWVCQLGTVPWREALALQEQIRARRQAGELPDTLLLLEHPPVYTRGRRSHAGELTLGEDFYRARGIEVVDTNRGGRVTYHAPGQLVGYPIMGVSDVLAHLRTIEQALVAALAQEGITARSRVDEGADYTGVWVGERKIASLGVHVSRGVSTHGFAVNVNNDLEPFSWVVACGLPDVEMTSVACELSPGVRRVDEQARQGRSERGVLRTRASEDAASRRSADLLTCFRKRVAFQFCQVHGRRQRLVTPQRLELDRQLVPA
jgi:lipoyl(octanoyl) transferase